MAAAPERDGVTPHNIATALRQENNAAQAGDMWAIVAPIGAMMPEGANISLSRTQKADFIGALPVGARVRILWYLAASLDEEVSELFTWNGEVVSILEQGRRLVEWDVGCVNLEEGGRIPLPAPDINGRLVEIVWAWKGRRPTAKLDLSALLVARPEDAAAPADRKRPRDLNETTAMMLGKTVSTLTQIMETKVGEEVLEKVELAPGLRVPAHVPKDFKPFYLHCYFAMESGLQAATSWKADFKESREKWGVVLTEDHNKEELWAMIDAIHSYIVTSFALFKTSMVTKDAWYMPMYILSRLISMCIVGIVKNKPGEAAIKFRAKMKEEWDKTPTTVNFPQWFRSAKGTTAAGTTQA